MEQKRAKGVEHQGMHSTMGGVWHRQSHHAMRLPTTADTAPSVRRPTFFDSAVNADHVQWTTPCHDH